MTVLIALTTRRSLPTVDILRPVALSLDRLVVETLLALVVVAQTSLTDPEVSTAVRVRVVAVGFVVAVQRRGTVSRLITVLVTLVTHRSAAAVGEVLVVAAVVLGVEHHGLPVLVVRAEEVLWRVETAELGAVPEPPAVEPVREVEAGGVLAGLPLVGRSAVPGGVQTAGEDCD